MRSFSFLLSTFLLFSSPSLLGKSPAHNVAEEAEWVYSDKTMDSLPAPKIETQFRYRIENRKTKLTIEYNRNGEWIAIPAKYNNFRIYINDHTN
jgi:hypothetical protein